MSNFFRKRPLLTGALVGSAAYGITLYASPSIVYMANFIVGSALIGLLGPVAAACAGWVVPFLACLAMGALVAWLTNSLVSLCFGSEQKAHLADLQQSQHHQLRKPQASKEDLGEGANEDLDEGANEDHLPRKRSRIASAS